MEARPEAEVREIARRRFEDLIRMIASDLGL
jgi:hypothetical protein